MHNNSRIFIAGHHEMVGSAILRKLQQEGFGNLFYRKSDRLDLTHQQQTESFFKAEKLEFVFLAAAKVGGIMANSRYPAEFIYRNLMIQNNVIHAAWKYGVEKLLFLGSSCIYPKLHLNP